MNLVSIRTGEAMVPVLYLDLDGTVRMGFDELGRFVNGPKDVIVFPQVPDLLKAYKNHGWRIMAISNQGGIALGHMTVRTCLAAMLETNRQCDNLFDKITFCIHHPNAPEPEMATCWCRKPRPGMVIESALSLTEITKEIYPPHLGLFVGDRPEDEQCAENAGLRFMHAQEWRTGAHLEELRQLGSES
jgi:D-glycero-D-manno-heptose 1,7-bisphosphate phosphatase